jgi:hypothetical protein
VSVVGGRFASESVAFDALLGEALNCGSRPETGRKLKDCFGVSIPASQVRVK